MKRILKPKYKLSEGPFFHLDFQGGILPSAPVITPLQRTL